MNAWNSHLHDVKFQIVVLEKQMGLNRKTKDLIDWYHPSIHVSYRGEAASVIFLAAAMPFSRVVS